MIDFQLDSQLIGIIQPFPFWKMEIQWENGLGGSGGYERIFSGVRVLEIREKIPTE